MPLAFVIAEPDDRQPLGHRDVTDCTLSQRRERLDIAVGYHRRWQLVAFQPSPHRRLHGIELESGIENLERQRAGRHYLLHRVNDISVGPGYYRDAAVPEAEQITRGQNGPFGAADA